VVNLDPAADVFRYECVVDVRDLVNVDVVLETSEEAKQIMGPNGALVYCIEYLVQNLEWLQERLNEATMDDDYLLFDCPGQIELYSHLPVMRQLTDSLRGWGFNVCSTFILDTNFCLDADKFLAAALTSLSAMITLETPAVNVLSKMDLLSKEDLEFVETLLEGDITSMLSSAGIARTEASAKWNEKHRNLTEQISTVLDDYSLVKFLPMNMDDEDTISDLLLAVDSQIQFGEDLDVKDRYPEEMDPEDFENTINGS